MRTVHMQRLFVGVVFAACVVLTLPAPAHHAVQAQFDVSTIDTFTAELVKVELINPHPYLFFKVADGEELKEWEIEAPALAALRRAGLLKRLKVGEVFTVNYAPSRNGVLVGLLYSVVLPDGKTIVTGTATDFRRRPGNKR